MMKYTPHKLVHIQKELYCKVFSNWFINETMMIKISKIISVIVNINI